jgi:hypothetical protein
MKVLIGIFTPRSFTKHPGSGSPCGKTLSRFSTQILSYPLFFLVNVDRWCTVCKLTKGYSRWSILKVKYRKSRERKE